jgi:hypothetical protein
VFAIATFRTPRWWRTVGLVIAILAALTLGNVLLVQQLPAGF